MFEQATLSGGPLSTRLWSTCAGLTGQAIIVGVTLLVPLVWPAALPQLRDYVNIVAPPGAPPPPPPPPHGATVRPRGTVRPLPLSAITLPPRVPDRVIPLVEDLPEPVSAGVPGGVPDGIPRGVPGGVVDSIMAAGRPAAPPPVAAVVRTPPPAAAPAVQPPPRLPVGGDVKLGAPIHRIEPVYPRIAQTAHIEGVVEIEAVVGIDGRVRELKAKRGHPFLIPAALDAVRQWIYTPTTLNGKPVEVISPITVTFRLGSR